MFLLGYISGQLPNGLRIGGPLGVFVLLFLLTPANEIKSLINPNLAECESNVDNRASVAQPFCEKAVAELPNEPRPLLLLGTAQSNTGRYREAIESWSRALNLGADKGLAYYNIAFAQYQLKDYESAIKSASLAANESESNKGLKALSWYLIAEAESALWKDGQGDGAHFVNARDKYLAFIETSSPTYRAEGNLACMLAAKATLTTDDAQKSAMEDQALAHFDNALASIKAYSGPNDSSEKLSFAAAFRPDANDCNKKLAELWARKRSDQSYDSVVASVPG